MARKGLILEDNKKLSMVNGDLVIDEVDGQNINLLLSNDLPGYMQFPLACVGVVKSLNGNALGAVRSQIKRKLKLDGYKVNSITNVSGNIDIDYDLINE